MRKKLTLNDLKVKSFITRDSQFDAKTIKAGAAPGGTDYDEKAPRTAKWYCGGDEPDGGETILNICETVYYDC